MSSFKNKLWLEDNSLSNSDKQKIVFKKLGFWDIPCKVIAHNGGYALRFTINTTEYTVVVDEYDFCLKILAQNKLRNKSGHKQHYIKNRKTKKVLKFEGNTCWDDLIYWVRKVKQNKLF